MYILYIGPQYILQGEYSLNYISGRVIGGSSQKGESFSEKCNKFERKMVFLRFF